MLHRRVPLADRKSDAEICEYLNVLFYSRPTWRDTFELRMSINPSATGDLTATLELIREMLSLRAVYGKLDAEQNGSVSSSLAVRHQANAVELRPGTSESSSAKRAFAIVMSAGDVAAAYSIASLSGMARATFDPKK